MKVQEVSRVRSRSKYSTERTGVESTCVPTIQNRFSKITHTKRSLDVFITPKSDHCLALSDSQSLHQSVLLLRLDWCSAMLCNVFCCCLGGEILWLIEWATNYDWCDPGVWRFTQPFLPLQAVVSIDGHVVDVGTKQKPSCWCQNKTKPMLFMPDENKSYLLMPEQNKNYFVNAIFYSRTNKGHVVDVGWKQKQFCWCRSNLKATYLLFVIFLHRQNFWRIKFTPKNA